MVPQPRPQRQPGVAYMPALQVQGKPVFFSSRFFLSALGFAMCPVFFSSLTGFRFKKKLTRWLISSSSRHGSADLIVRHLKHRGCPWLHLWFGKPVILGRLSKQKFDLSKPCSWCSNRCRKPAWPPHSQPNTITTKKRQFEFLKKGHYSTQQTFHTFDLLKCQTVSYYGTKRPCLRLSIPCQCIVRVYGSQNN